MKLLLSLFALSLPMLACASSIAESEQRPERVNQFDLIESKSFSFATTYGTAISAPVGRLLLMRKKNDLCAIRFTEFHRGNDARPQTSFHTDEETLYAEYDWFYQGDGSGDFTKNNIKSGHSQLTRKATIGYGHLLHIQSGKVMVKCGPLKATWGYPNRIWLVEDGGAYRGNEIELSPTKWESVLDVTASDPKVIWYQYDDNRKMTYIPLEELPGVYVKK